MYTIYVVYYQGVERFSKHRHPWNFWLSKNWIRHQQMSDNDVLTGIVSMKVPQNSLTKFYKKKFFNFSFANETIESQFTVKLRIFIFYTLATNGLSCCYGTLLKLPVYNTDIYGALYKKKCAYCVLSYTEEYPCLHFTKVNIATHIKFLFRASIRLRGQCWLCCAVVCWMERELANVGWCSRGGEQFVLAH